MYASALSLKKKKMEFHSTVQKTPSFKENHFETWKNREINDSMEKAYKQEITITFRHCINHLKKSERCYENERWSWVLELAT